MTDRTTKALLGIIAAALSLNLIHAFIAPVSPARADGDPNSITVVPTGDGSELYITRGPRSYLYFRKPKVNANSRITGYTYRFLGSVSSSQLGQDFTIDDPRYKADPAAKPDR